LHLAKSGDVAKVKELMMSKARLVHWFSLLSALAVQELQLADSTLATMGMNNASLGVSHICVWHSPSNRLSRQSTQPSLRCSGLAVRLGRSNSVCNSRGTVVSGERFEPELDNPGNAVCIIGDLTLQELTQLECAHDRPLIVMKWIFVEVSRQTLAGNLLVAPPIISRVYQEISNGMLAFFMANMKISMVPFPFPFAQVLTYALYAFYFVSPFIVLEELTGETKLNIRQILIPLLLNFATCVGYASVNEIAVELEEPFGFDSNDYPVHAQQNIIVRTLEDTFCCQAPTDFTSGFFDGSDLTQTEGMNVPSADDVLVTESHETG